jgi:hypothetical protein
VTLIRQHRHTLWSPDHRASRFEATVDAAAALICALEQAAERAGLRTAGPSKQPLASDSAPPRETDPLSVALVSLRETILDSTAEAELQLATWLRANPLKRDRLAVERRL